MKFILLVILLITLNQFAEINQALAQTIHLDSIAVITDSRSSDTVNISLMVLDLIKQAKLKNEFELKRLSETKDTTLIAEQLQSENNDSTILTSQLPTKPEIKEEATRTSIVETESKEDGVISFNLAVLSSAAVLAVGFVSVKRIKFSKKSGMNKLKKNIDLMREEKFVRAADKKLSQLRSTLRKNAEYLTTKENSVSLTAKGLNISKGELMLAAKIKSFELSKSCSLRQ